jgi:hypothetical protein
MTELMYAVYGGGILFFIVFMASMLQVVRCKHPSPSWPQHGVQKCHHCGLWRMYELDGHVGRWLP